MSITITDNAIIAIRNNFLVTGTDINSAEEIIKLIKRQLIGDLPENIIIAIKNSQPVEVDFRELSNES